MTNGSPGTAPRAFRLNVPQRIMLITTALAAVAVALFVIVVRPLPGAPTALNLPWVLWAAAFAISEAFPVHVQVKKDSHTFSISDLVLAAGLVLAQPSHLVAAQAGGVAVALFVHRKQRGLKLAFNAALCALTACVATSVYAAVSAPLSETWYWLAALAAVLGANLVGNACIFAVISVSEGRVDLRKFVEMCTPTVPAAIAAAAIGLVVARTVVNDPAALALLALPTTLIIVAYRFFTKANLQQENLRRLHEVTALLHHGDSHAALGEFLTSVRSAFRAEMAELLLLDTSDHEQPSISSSREGHESVALAPLQDREGYEGLLRLAMAAGVLTTRGGVGRGGQLDAYAAERGLKDTIAAVLRTDDRVHGLLLIGGRHGEVSSFTDSDLALLETFSRHVGTSLERGRLEETLRQVTDLKEQLRHQALHDPLTGLPNRTLYLDRAKHAVESAGRTHEWPAILYIDLD
ncbi:MAG TPA: GAF domain-containing protein, partial [Gaiellales bacterium]|nr:GAF domain-containing protein [Gaiellales bacterium]